MRPVPEFVLPKKRFPAVLTCRIRVRIRARVKENLNLDYGYL